MKRILSIQGGGIRGIIPCCALIALEEQTGKRANEIFDFVAGTSTGALLAATIVAGVPARISLQVYLQHGKEIFSPTDKIGRYMELVATGRQFDNRVLYRIVGAALGAARTWRINDSPMGMLITAADQLGDCVYFVRDAPTNAGQTGKYSLLDAAVASACATTYHDPWLVSGLGWCADGGTAGVADPVYQACVEAFQGEKCYGSIDPHNARVISLGTGHYRPPKMPGPPHTLIDRISWVTSALVGASKTVAAQSVERHWPGVLQVLNPELPEDIDEADVGDIPTLLTIGQSAAAQMDWRKILEL